MRWVSPVTSSGGDWNFRDLAYDGSTVSSSYSLGSPTALVMGLTAIPSSKLRLWVSQSAGSPVWTVSVRYGGSYHQIHSGTLSAGIYHELVYGGVFNVDSVQIFVTNSPPYTNRVHEVSLWETAH